MGDVDVFEPNPNPAAAARWVAVGGGFVTAAGAPSRSRLRGWPARGVTDVVTLQRADEMSPWLPGACAEVGLGWHHHPLSGRRLERAEDRETIGRLSELAARLAAGPACRMVFHCAAGMHRTGLALYLVLRHAGMTPQEAVAAVAAARPITGQELQRPTRAGPALVETAERCFARTRRR